MEAVTAFTEFRIVKLDGYERYRVEQLIPRRWWRSERWEWVRPHPLHPKFGSTFSTYERAEEFIRALREWAAHDRDSEWKPVGGRR